MEMYIDNVRADINIYTNTNYGVSTATTGHIVLGYYLAGGTGTYNYAAFTCDSLTIWDRVLTTEERMLIHAD